MKFTYKNEAELSAMTPEQRDIYGAQKREHEAAEAKLEMTAAIDAAKSELTSKVETLNEVIKTQGAKIVELEQTKSSGSSKDEFEVTFKEAYDNAVSGNEHTVRESLKFDLETVKLSTDVMSVNTVPSSEFPTAGSTGVVSANLQSIYGKVIGFFSAKRTKSRIMELVDIQPMDNLTLIAINETVTGDAAITKECMLKPIVKMAFTTEEKSAEAVAVEWFTTTKLRRFFKGLYSRMLQKFGELVNDKIPDIVLDFVRTNSTAFTAVPAMAINSNPNNYDALGAAIAAQEQLGWDVNAIMLSPIAWRNMKQEKTTDGIYTLSNGNSISLLDNYLDWGGVQIPLIKDPKLSVDEFIIGDLSVVKVGLDSQLMYFETDGRTDSDTSSTSGVSRNIRTHVLEKFMVTMIPTSQKAGVVKDTFANVKTLITKAA